MMLAVLAFVLAAPPEFVVVNKTGPAFTVVNKTKAPAVAKAKAATFRNYGYHAGHNCPSCGEERTKLDSGVLRGWHNHKCQSCGTVWRHSG